MEPNDKKRSIDWLNDDWLDAALRQYGQAEPRPGLENRVLAAVRAEREHRTSHKWPAWAALAAVTAILLIGAGVFLSNPRTGRVSAPLAKENQSPLERNAPAQSQAEGAQIEELAGRRIRSGVPRTRPHHVLESATARSEQFPSPEPLSAQEIILARYVEQFPHEADLMARAQTELTRQEMMEQQIPIASQIPPSSEPENQ